MPLKDDLINPSTTLRINALLERGVAEVIDREHLEKRLARGEKLRVKFGIDPTMPALHLGHAVVLRKLRQFQDAGHQAVFIVGDFTATIGDPSGRSELRPKLTRDEVRKNMKDYTEEAGKIIDLKKAEVRYNSQWYANKDVSFLMELTSNFTIARCLERDDFQKRIKEDRDISVLEVLYPIMQGYDSVEVRADVELGGTDQKFNLLMGRKVQRRYGLPEQDILTTPLLEGTDGVRKMSKSIGNYIGLSENPNEMFAKVMSIPDDLIVKYFTLLTDVAESEIEQLTHDGLLPSTAKRSPKEWKEMLSSEIVRRYHGEEGAQKAAEEFRKVFSGDELPQDMPVVKVSAKTKSIGDLLVETGLASSKSEARRLVEQGGVKIDGAVETSAIKEIALREGMVVQVGKRRFAKIARIE